MKRLILALTISSGLLGCTGEAPPQRDCLARVWVEEGRDVGIVGSWDAWTTVTRPEPFEPGWRLARMELPSGEHAYLLQEGRKLVVDPHQPLTTFGGPDDPDEEVSLLIVPDCSTPELRIDRAVTDGDEIVIGATFLASASADPLASVSAGDLRVTLADPHTGAVELRGPARPGKQTFSVVANDSVGQTAEANVAVWDEPRDPRDEVIYQAMIDRFRGNGGSALAPPATPGARAGGTLDGLRASLGELREIGATTVWLSPVYQGPREAREGKDGRLYESYHGYWPLETRVVEPRIGGEEALEAFVAEAHGAGVAVLADVVPNHVYERHERYAAHEGWFTEPGCVCGTPSCPWNEHIVECWFAPYLPDVRWQDPGALAAAVDDVAWLVTRFDLDGVRIDAVPMMPRAASRRIAERLREDLAPEGALFLLGEVFTGPGAGGLSELRRHLGPAGMNGVFDFPLMWAMQDAIATGRGGFDAVEAILQLEEEELAGSGGVLARILDNHDTPRFVTVAHGDAYGDPWTAPAEQPDEAEPYERLRIALALIFTLPGIPVLYQGDEIGLAGAGDPDNRRVMPSTGMVGELNEHQHHVREAVKQLARLRACSTALRRGERVLVEAARRRYVFARRHEGETVIVALSTSDDPEAFAAPFPGPFVDAITGESFDSADFELAPKSYRILVSGSECRQ